MRAVPPRRRRPRRRRPRRLPGRAPPALAPSSSPSPGADVAFEVVADGLAAPIGLVTAPGDAGRSFIVDQLGQIQVLRGDELLVDPFLDIADRIIPLDTSYDERGLLGLAFHPEFATNGRFFVYYTARRRDGAGPDDDHTNTLSEFRVSSTDPDRADVGSERKVLEFEQPQPNHSGGALGFGPDGFLYLGTGDGGGRGDADAGHSDGGNAQDTAKLNGKIMRIDVDAGGGAPYGVPPDNPFVEGGGRPEIYAFGFRNPWRLSWEPAGARRLLVSDVGYGRYEEVDVVELGANYGWRIREGAHCLDIDAPLEETEDCPSVGVDGAPLVDPVIEYTHRDVGVAVVGGYVYRGTALADLAGEYVFADYSADWTTVDPRPHGSMLVATPRQDPAETWTWRRLTVDGDPLGGVFVTGMGEDAGGEIYVMTRQQSGPLGRSGRVYRIVPAAG